MKKIVAIGVLLLNLMMLHPAHADHMPQVINGWSLVGTSDQGDIYIKNGSLKIIKNNIMAISQLLMLETKQATVYKLYIGRQSCEEGVGTITIYGLDGALITQWDYVDGGVNISSSVGTYMCSIVRN